MRRLVGGQTQTQVTGGTGYRLRSAQNCSVCEIRRVRHAINDIIGLAGLSAYYDGEWRRWDAVSSGAVVSVSQGKAMLRASSPVSRLRWRKSTYSLASGECVETAAVSGGVVVRDSCRQFDTPLQFQIADWRNFIDAIKRREC